MAFVYRHIRLDKNEPFYIGIGFGKTNYRAYQKTKTKRSVFWQNIVSKTEYRVEILFENVSKEFAMKKEIEFISLYGRKDLGTGTLVNMTIGGENPPALCGDKNSMKNPESRLKLSRSRIGIKFTEEHKLKLSQSKKLSGIIPPSRKGFKMSICGVSKMVASRLKNGHRRKTIYQFDKNGVLIKEWRYAEDIKKQNPKYSKGNIAMVCRGERKIAYGYFWSYLKPKP